MKDIISISLKFGHSSHPVLIINSFIQVGDSNKPPEVLEKIINGRMKKFYSDVCLTEQEHMVEEGKTSVAKALKKDGLEVKRFESFFI